MKRGFLHGAAALALLSAAAACAPKPVGTDIGMGTAKGSDPLMILSANPPGTLLWADSGQGSGGHLTADSVGIGSGGHLKVLCSHPTVTVDPSTNIVTLICPPKATADSGMGSGGHRAVLLMDCPPKSPGQELVCTAPAGTARRE
jgi:hypothetical protein